MVIVFHVDRATIAIMAEDKFGFKKKKEKRSSTLQFNKSFLFDDKSLI